MVHPLGRGSLIARRNNLQYGAWSTSLTDTPPESLPSFDAPDGGSLTPEMVEAYRQAGVLILEDFVSREACAELRARTQELVDEFDPAEVHGVFSTTSQEQLNDAYFIESGGEIRFFLENDAFDDAGQLRDTKENCLNKMGHAMHDLDPVFEKFSHSAALAEIVNRLGNSDPAIIQSMYIFKPPRIGGEVVCHQDSTYIYTEPESCIGFWFALEDATTENGCMHFIPGQHKEPLKARNYRSGENSLTTEVLDSDPWPEHRKVAAPARAGTLVIFDGRSPHMSGPNVSDKSRHAYTLHIIDQRCHYPAENWLQRSTDLPLRGPAPIN
jgi:phytanoyl-CoA hydroxylase